MGAYLSKSRNKAPEHIKRVTMPEDILIKPKMLVPYGETSEITPEVKTIYGVAILAIIYFIVQQLYSVYYTPGVTTVYNSPQAQKLFPNTPNKLFPTWGYTKSGMYEGQAFKFGQGKFWPDSGKGFVPNKLGSGGPSPSGGMRSGGGPIPAESEVGYWGYTPSVEKDVNLDIYDNSSQHVEYDTPVGWWGN